MGVKHNLVGDEKHTIYTNVQKFGGGFEKALSEALMRADAGNTMKICLAFPEFIQKWLDDKWNTAE